MMRYLVCSGAEREFVALAAVPADAGATTSVLLLGPVIRMSDAGKAVVELRFGEIVLHHWEWELAAGAVFHLPGKMVLNAGYSLYFASYAAGASLEACAVIDDAVSGDVATGVPGGTLPILIPPGAWYIEETQTWMLGCRATWSLDGEGMPDTVTYSDKVAVPYNIVRAARQNTGETTLSSATDISALTFGVSPGAKLVIIGDGPVSSQNSALAKIADDYNEVDAKYQMSINGTSEIRSTWTNEDETIDKYPETRLITGQYGPGAATTPGSPNIVSAAWPMRDISDAVAAFPDANITAYNFAGVIYDEVYP